MNAKHITDITIENFRGIGKLKLNGLQAVNLIVGQNNAGKTSLLEAIAAVCLQGKFDRLPGLFRFKTNEPPEAFASDQDGTASRYLRWLVADEQNFAEVRAHIRAEIVSLGLFRGEPDPGDDAGYAEGKQYGDYALRWGGQDPFWINTSFISVQHSTPENLVPSFADAVRSPGNEALMVSILNKVDDRVKSLRLDFNGKDPFIAVDVGLSERVPLPHVGQGIYRMVAILSDLLGAKPQVCLIDEIENGLHYTALKQIWKGIAEISSTLGIQVFATTHSRECLEAANEVFCSDDPEQQKDFAVIQLLRVKGQVMGKVLSEARVDAAVENDIELR